MSPTLLAESRGVFPVLVFSHGLGGMRTTNSGLVCDLTSHGYIVASVEHRYIINACAIIMLSII